MSVKLYYENRYLTEFESVVLSCRPDKKGWAVVLEKTAFYPEGGGQPSDRGVMTYDDITANISDVREKGGEITHYSDIEIPVGATVKGVIDWNRRFDFMQQHTGEHMFSGMVNSMFGFKNVGFHLSEKDNVVDFDGRLSKEDIKRIMDKCNEYVWLDQPVNTGFPENVKELEYRSKKDLTGDIRIVRAGDADICACCGTHTATTGRAGPIVALNSIAYKGGTRINILCGKRAVEYLKRRNDDCYDISRQLSLPVESITSGVAARMKEIEELKMALGAAKRQLIALWVRTTQPEEDICVMAKDNLTSNEIQQLCRLLAEKARTAVVYSRQEGGNPKICIISSVKDTNKLGRHISAVLGGKGGGKPGIYQGFVESRADEMKLAEIIKEFV